MPTFRIGIFIYRDVSIGAQLFYTRAHHFTVDYFLLEAATVEPGYNITLNTTYLDVGPWGIMFDGDSYNLCDCRSLNSYRYFNT